MKWTKKSKEENVLKILEKNNIKPEITVGLSLGEYPALIRENELHMTKIQLGKEIGISGQFLGLIENGRGNLVYPSLKKLMNISGHSADYILFGLDDSIISNTQKILDKYQDKQIIESIKLIENISIFMKNL